VIGVTGQSAMTNRQSAISIPRYVFYSTVRAGKRPRPVSNVPCRELGQPALAVLLDTPLKGYLTCD
jgi:hypothetical protein